jgi:hypothetical protein
LRAKPSAPHPRRAEAVAINRLIVECAEDIVFSHDERDWIEESVAKQRHCRIEAVTELVATQRIIERRAGQ